MIDGEQGRVIICSGTASATMMMPMTMPGMRGVMPDHGKPKDHGKTDMPCAFSGLSAAMLGAIDPVQLAALIAFVVALALVVTLPPPISRPAYLRPPLRGPPAYL